MCKTHVQKAIIWSMSITDRIHVIKNKRIEVGVTILTIMFSDQFGNLCFLSLHQALWDYMFYSWNGRLIPGDNVWVSLTPKLLLSLSQFGLLMPADHEVKKKSYLEYLPTMKRYCCYCTMASRKSMSGIQEIHWGSLLVLNAP